jgi:hypothetical protein
MHEKEQGEDSQPSKLPLGTVLNDCSLMHTDTYLSDFKIVFDESEKPVIAVITKDDLKECLVKTDADQLEKMINFS